MDDSKRGSHDGEQDPHGQWDASRVLEMELEARDQERIAISKLVDQAQQLVQDVIHGKRKAEALVTAGDYLGKASQILKWPLPFGPNDPAVPPVTDDERSALLKQVTTELDRALEGFATARD